MRKHFNLLIVLASFFLVFGAAYASIEVFSNYNTNLKINSDNTIEINKSLTLKNVYDTGIVPGQIEFKLAKSGDGGTGNIEVENVKAYDSYNNEIKTQIRKTNDYTVIILDVYYPLLPGFEYDFSLYYKLSYAPGGIFFKSLQVPLRESTIPIQSGQFKVSLPENYYFTYLNSGGTNSSVVKNVATWEITNDLPQTVTFEYSYLPVRFGDLKGSYVFWFAVNILLFAILVFEIRREIKRIRKHDDD